MTATHTPGCPAIADVRDGCSCLLREADGTPCLHLAEMYVGETAGRGSVIECLACGRLNIDDSQAPPPSRYAAALDAATEAVAAMRPETDPDIAHVIVSDVLAALAAIAALKATP